MKQISRGQYIEETSKQLKYRIKEHSSAIKNNDIKNFAIANHYGNCYSTINYKLQIFSINIIDKCNGFSDRKIIEAYRITISKPDLNRNTGLHLTT